MAKKITAVIVGAGHRSMLYGRYASEHPDEFQIVGVADPDPVRRRRAAERFSVPGERCYESAEELAVHPQFADAVINGTMDNQHVKTAIPLLYKGYHMLLEKPFAVNEKEIWQLADAVKKTDRKVMICHVLRYAPFYASIKNEILKGTVGDIINIQLTEHVSYHHLSAAYVRGKWNNEVACGASMLLAKCCHDVDLLMWFKSGIAARRVSSFGSDFQFSPEKIPANAGTRCMADCQVEAACDYSARKLYIDHPDRWGFYVWDRLPDNAGIEDKIRSLEEDNPHGLCAWKCGHNVVDHQSVMLEFSDGATATLNMIGGTAKAERNIHIVGTNGEIKGVFDDSIFTIRRIDHTKPDGWAEQTVDLAIGGDTSGMNGSHGGGDLRMVKDFVHVLQGEKPSVSYTGLSDSINGHLAVFLAEQARKNFRVMDFPGDLIKLV